MTIDVTKLVVMNAAGMVKTRSAAEKLLDSAVTRILAGSTTVNERGGNIEEVYFFNPVTRTAYNSKGLDNLGWKKTRDWLAEFLPECHAHGKELGVSIAPFSPEESGFLAQEFGPFVDIIELNAGCPNVWGHGGRKPIISYDPDLLRAHLEAIRGTIHNRRLAVKISPIGDGLIPELAKVFNEYQGMVCEVDGVNTKPDQRGTRPDGSDALAFREHEGAELKHVGGMSGAGLAEDSLRVSLGMQEHLHPSIGYIDCGGIFTGADVVERHDQGSNAKGFAVGTAFFEQGPRVFSEILQEIVELEAD